MNFRMFENTAGIDVVRAQHLDLSGRHIDNAAPIEGRLFTVESFYVLAFFRRMLGGASKHNKPKYSQHKSRELAWWSSDDQLPFLIMCVRLFMRPLGRALTLWLDSLSLLRPRLSRLFSQ
jgi:hypothetical protein